MATKTTNKKLLNQLESNDRIRVNNIIYDSTLTDIGFSPDTIISDTVHMMEEMLNQKTDALYLFIL